MLKLKEANFDDIEKEWQFVRDMPEDENGLTNDWFGKKYFVRIKK